MPDSSQPYIERIEARAFSRATEISDRVKRAILHIFPEDIWEHVTLEEELTEGHHKNPIRVLTAILEEPHTDKASRFIFSKLIESDVNLLLETLDRRIDEECTFFLRIDKQAAYLGHIEIARGADVISMQLHIRKSPRCKSDDAKELIEHYVSFAGETS